MLHRAFTTEGAHYESNKVLHRWDGLKKLTESSLTISPINLAEKSNLALLFYFVPLVKPVAVTTSLCMPSFQTHRQFSLSGTGLLADAEPSSLNHFSLRAWAKCSADCRSFPHKARGPPAIIPDWRRSRSTY